MDKYNTSVTEKWLPVGWPGAVAGFGFPSFCRVTERFLMVTSCAPVGIIFSTVCRYSPKKVFFLVWDTLLNNTHKALSRSKYTSRVIGKLEIEIFFINRHCLLTIQRSILEISPFQFQSRKAISGVWNYKIICRFSLCFFF